MTILPLPKVALLPHIHAAFGAECRLLNGRPLTDGTRKKVSLLELSGGPGQVVLLVWNNEHDYFNERDDADNLMNDRNAPALYRANTERLLMQGLRVPRIYAYDDRCVDVPYAFALVEYVQAQTLNEFRVGKSEEQVGAVMVKLRAYLDQLSTITRPVHGTILDSATKQIAYPDLVLRDTMPVLDGLASVTPDVARVQTVVRERLVELHAQMSPRDRFTFVHGELGPDEHFLIEQDGGIVILDMDGCQFADLEREHAYLKLRFAEYETYFRRPDLDPIRMQFYGLHLHISAAYGHYQLMVKGYSGTEMLREIYEYNAAKVVAWVQS